MPLAWRSSSDISEAVVRARVGGERLDASERDGQSNELERVEEAERRRAAAHELEGHHRAGGVALLATMRAS